MSAVRIATRGSELALAQASSVASRLRSELRLESEIVVVETTGDRVQGVSLAKIGGKGLFVKEIEEALLAGRADVAVHSAKDLPAAIAPGLELIAFPERRDPRDALVARAGKSLLDLPDRARVGTGSTRRRAQLLAVRPDLEIAPLRGNVTTRLRKLESESLDALVLACAGLDRLGLSAEISERISPDLLLPAVCQGALALEARRGDPLRSKLALLDDPEVSLAARAERSFLARLGGDCATPIAVYAERMPGGELRVRGLLASPDGSRIARHESRGDARDPEAIAGRVADGVLADGGAEILRELEAP
jgi:hydroxymethylbilane synthase